MASFIQKLQSRLNPVPHMYRMLGAILERKGATSLALVCLKESAKADSRNPAAAYALGKALLLNEDFQGAAEAFKQAIRLAPDFFEAHNNLGVTLEKLDLLDEASEAYGAALRISPGYAHANNNIGNIWLAKRRYDEAEICYREVLKTDPTYIEALNNLSVALNLQGSFKEAEQTCEEAIRIDPTYAGAYCNLGSVLQNQGRAEEAISAYDKALELQPGLMEAAVNRALLIGDERALASVVPYFEKQVKRYPDSFVANTRFATALRLIAKFDEATKYLEEAIKLKPDYAEAYSGLGNIAAENADIDGALHHYGKALSLAPNSHIQQCLVFHTQYQSETTAEKIFAMHLENAKAWEAPMQIHRKAHRNLPDPSRKLRIGYVSSDFRLHSVSAFVESIVRAHDRSAFHVTCYAHLAKPDAVTERFKATADAWRDIRLKTDEQVCELIREDEIDILVDLNGYTSGNRLQVFARKPAPVQVTYVGYPDTTGFSTMDYRITDAFADPPGMTERYHSERLTRLPGSFLLFSPMENAVEVAVSPHKKKGCITFGSFNNANKVNEATIALWSKVMHAVPDSRLLLKSMAFSQPPVKKRFTDMFAAHGIAEERLSLIGFASSVSNHLDLYSEVDIALDTMPYNGTTTTCEALWMGVPVVTLAGARHVARVGVSLLSNVGLESLIADDEDAYVNIAVRLANDSERLVQLRASLRTMMQQSPLMNEPAFMRNLEAAYRGMWRQWCADSIGEAAA